MNPVIVKAYGWLKPANEDCAKALEHVLESWYISNAIETDGPLLRIAHEGVHFPAEDIMLAMVPFLGTQSEGKLDVLNLEDWTLTRYTWPGGIWQRRESSLDRALEKSCGR